MGGGTSRPSEPAMDISPEQLDAPQQQGDERIYHAIPLDAEIQKKSPTVLLEVGRIGFRVLKPKLNAPLLLFPWGQIHSWSHAQKHFSFRYFDDSKRAIQQLNLCLRDVDPLLEFIQQVVDSILEDRKVNAISTADFEAILSALKRTATSLAAPLDVIVQHAQDRYFMADQGSAMMAVLPSTFDKIEVAVMLHSRLVDQSRFAVMLEQFGDPQDRDNVWARITAAKVKIGSSLSAGGRLGSSLRLTSSVGGAGGTTGGAIGSSGPSSPVAGAVSGQASPLTPANGAALMSQLTLGSPKG